MREKTVVLQIQWHCLIPASKHGVEAQTLDSFIPRRLQDSRPLAGYWGCDVLKDFYVFVVVDCISFSYSASLLSVFRESIPLLHLQ